MKAIQIHRYGDTNTMVYEEVPKPIPKSNEVLIQIHSVGVNPADFRSRQGLAHSLWGSDPFPVILGYDVSGSVVETGPGVSKFKIGDEVYGMIRFPYIGQAYAEYTTASVNEIALKPKSINHNHTAALPMPALTAWQALFDPDKGNLQATQTILIHGASGGVGHIAVQLAKWKGARVVGTASARKADFLRKLGVDIIIDYAKEPLETIVKDEEVDVVLFGVPSSYGKTNTSIEPSLRTLKHNGRLISISKKLDTELEGNKLYQTKNIHSSFFSVHANATQLEAIAKLIDSGALYTELHSVLPLKEARKAHEIIETGHVQGKIVLQVLE